MAWNVIDLPGARIEEFGTTKEFSPGQTCKARNTTSGFIGEFIYLQGIGSTATGLWVSINPDTYVTALLADGHVGGCAVAMGACVASNYGWYQTCGKASAMVAAAVADNAALFVDAAGVAIATASGKSEIIGARCAEAADASSAGNIEVELNYPQCASPAGA